ncbi:unnamed protein product [Amoebophrya sp. A120]|nr:unnamed protein product [Amoebophrya sp. A120]|eukprot:GSA120T00010294001.1
MVSSEPPPKAAKEPNSGKYQHKPRKTDIHTATSTENCTSQLRFLKNYCRTNFCGPCLAGLAVPVLLVLFLTYAAAAVPVVIVGGIIGLLQKTLIPLLVEYWYQLRCVGSWHVWYMKRKARLDEEIYHSRTADLRVELIPGRRWVHLIPMFQDNYAYLIVDLRDPKNFSKFLKEWSENKKIAKKSSAVVKDKDAGAGAPAPTDDDDAPGHQVRPNEVDAKPKIDDAAGKEESASRDTEEVDDLAAEGAKLERDLLASVNTAEELHLEDDEETVTLEGPIFEGVLIDPAAGESVERAVDYISHEFYGCELNLEAILTTHKHWDHSGGNVYFRKQYPDTNQLDIYATECNLPSLQSWQNFTTVSGDDLTGSGNKRSKRQAGCILSIQSFLSKCLNRTPICFLPVVFAISIMYHSVLFFVIFPVRKFFQSILDVLACCFLPCGCCFSCCPRRLRRVQVVNKQLIKDKEIFKIGTNMTFQCMITPAHTRTHGIFLLLDPAFTVEQNLDPKTCPRIGLPRQAQEVTDSSRRGKNFSEAPTSSSTTVVAKQPPPGAAVKAAPKATTQMQMNFPKHALFTGDTIFCGGHGACFEGNEIEMLRNFYLILISCSKNTLLFPGHEYTNMLLSDQLSNIGMYTNSLNLKEFSDICFQTWTSLHRRNMTEAKERVPTVPLHLEDEVLLNPNFRIVQERRLRMVELFQKRFLKMNTSGEEKGKEGEGREPSGASAANTGASSPPEKKKDSEKENDDTLATVASPTDISPLLVAPEQQTVGGNSSSTATTPLVNTAVAANEQKGKDTAASSKPEINKGFFQPPQRPLFAQTHETLKERTKFQVIPDVEWQRFKKKIPPDLLSEFEKLEKIAQTTPMKHGEEFETPHLADVGLGLQIVGLTGKKDGMISKSDLLMMLPVAEESERQQDEDGNTGATTAGLKAQGTDAQAAAEQVGPSLASLQAALDKCFRKGESGGDQVEVDFLSFDELAAKLDPEKYGIDTRSYCSRCGSGLLGCLKSCVCCGGKSSTEEEQAESEKDDAEEEDPSTILLKLYAQREKQDHRLPDCTLCRSWVPDKKFPLAREMLKELSFDHVKKQIGAEQNDGAEIEDTAGGSNSPAADEQKEASRNNAEDAANKKPEDEALETGEGGDEDEKNRKKRAKNPSCFYAAGMLRQRTTKTAADSKSTNSAVVTIATPDHSTAS